MTKICVAIVLFLLGRWIELWLKSRKNRLASGDSTPLLHGEGVVYDLLDADEEFEEPLL